MATLTAKDAEGALRFVAAAEDLGGDEPFGPAVLSELGQLLHADWIKYSEEDLDRDRCLVSHGHPSFGEVYGMFDFAAAAHVENPLLSYQKQGHFEAVRLSELLPSRALRRTSHYRLVLEPLGVTDRLGVAIPSRSNHAKRFGLDRVGGNFSTRDRLVLDLLQPHFGRLWRAAQTRRRLQAALAALESEAEDQARGLIVLAPGGGIEVISPAARRLVREYFGGLCDTDLPPGLADWLETGARTLRREPDRQLTVERSGDALLLEETRDELGLTARERQILAWVARGKTNAEIAQVLWIAPTTVRKHLENVYAKLGVRTRTAAAARFLGVLDAAEREERIS